MILLTPILSPILSPSAIALVYSNILFFLGLFAKGYVDSAFDLAAQNPSDYIIYEIYNISFLFIFLFGAFILPSLASLIREPKQRQPPKRVQIFGYIVIYFLMMWVVIINVKVEAAAMANSIFQRQLMALTPLISEEERKEILGHWAMMKSHSDYIKINHEIKNLATKYDTELPMSAWH